MRSWPNFTRKPEAPIEQPYDRKHALELPEAREIILDNLEIAVCDSRGRRFKEREVRAAMKTVARL